MQIEKRLREKLQAAFQPLYLELVNESHMHSVPAHSETHFRLVIVSAQFEGLNRVARQRQVNAVIQEELEGPVHAFSQRTLSPAEWEKVKDQFEMSSPPCASKGSDSP